MTKNSRFTSRSARSVSVQRNAPARRERRTMWLLVLLCIAAYLPALVGLLFGAMPFAEDALSLFGPWREWSKRALWDGHLPLWNPHIFGGLPFMGNGQSSILYLPNLIYWVLPVPVALSSMYSAQRCAGAGRICSGARSGAKSPRRLLWWALPSL
jgi:hypothetical protein